MSPLPSAFQVRVLELKRAGYTNQGVASIFGCAVQDVLDIINGISDAPPGQASADTTSAGVLLHFDASAAVPDLNASTTLHWPASGVLFDSDGFFNAVADDKVLKVPVGKAGLYAMYGTIGFSRYDFTGWRSASLLTSGFGEIDQDRKPSVDFGGGTAAALCKVFAVRPMAEGDWVRLDPNGTALGTLFAGAGRDLIQFGMHRIGALPATP